MFDSVEALLDVVCDAAKAGLLVERDGRLGMGDAGESLDGTGGSELRLSRSPGSYSLSTPPAGTELTRSASPEWPPEWLLPYGVTDGTLALRGATHTIAQLVAEASGGPVQGTIRGRVVTGSGGMGWWNPVVDDGTGSLVVSCNTTLLPVRVNQGQQGEFDVLLESADAAEPITDADPRVARIAERLGAILPTAHALAARPVAE